MNEALTIVIRLLVHGADGSLCTIANDVAQLALTCKAINGECRRLRDRMIWSKRAAESLKTIDDACNLFFYLR